MKKNLCFNCFSLLVGLLMVLSAKADVQLPRIFSSNMVLQRNMASPVWGCASPGEQVSVSIKGQHYQVVADEKGNWKVKLEPMQAGGPYEMTIQGKNLIRLENVLVGDVWLCSGQSNMAWPVQLSRNGDEEVAGATNTRIRILTVPQKLSLTPEKDVEEEWQVSTPATIADFSAVGYFFGRILHDSLGVSIGLIDASWGGSMIEPWISLQRLQEVDELSQKIRSSQQKGVSSPLDSLKQKFSKIAGPIPDKDPGLLERWDMPEHNDKGWKKMKLPQVWEKAGFAGLNGIVWYRKEFTLSREQASSKDVVLELGPVDDSETTYLNGQVVGKTHGEWAKPRTYQVPAGVLRPGKNVVVVRVEDTGGDGGFRGEAEQLVLSALTWKVPLAGEWRYKIGEVKADLTPNEFPSGLFNAMIHPLIPFAIKGALWYQGESNVDNAKLYRRLMPMMIEDWRGYWQQGEFPFLMVQLANFGKQQQEPDSSMWAELREAQLLTALNHPNTGMAVTIDIGEGNNIHPKNKQDVGKRLALLALAKTYGRSLEYSGPVYRDYKIEQDKIRINFDHTAGGLMSGDGSKDLKGFSVAGEDGVFKWARAYIDQHSVVVYSPEVKAPKHVRYGWEDNPEEVNLYNTAGLPASPFRTDVPE